MSPKCLSCTRGEIQCGAMLFSHLVPIKRNRTQMHPSLFHPSRGLVLAANCKPEFSGTTLVPGKELALPLWRPRA